ncbi:MAG TPA: hypothetical protein PLF32_09000 [Bacteroidales bacterium]|nr:hypothetical protein [Bacteroidales bacterium]HOR82775.1 hypothetical protein [Bacteroidales bacterium]HPJ92029.1 hypothetical protein [Bacteroidales bacterium]
MKKIIIICFVFMSFKGFSQTESDMKKYYAIIDYIVNNDSVIKTSHTYFNKYKSSNLYLSSFKGYLLLGGELAYKIYIDNFKHIDKEEFNSDYYKYRKPMWEGYSTKDSIEGNYLKDSLYKNLSEYLEQCLKRKSDDNLKWEFLFSTIYYNCVSVDIRKINNQLEPSLNFIFLFDDKDRIKEVKTQIYMGP